MKRRAVLAKVNAEKQPWHETRLAAVLKYMLAVLLAAVIVYGGAIMFVMLVHHSLT